MFGILILLFHLWQPSFVVFDQFLKFNELSRCHMWLLLFFRFIICSCQLFFSPTMLGTTLFYFLAHLFNLLIELFFYVDLFFLDLLTFEPEWLNLNIDSIDQILRHNTLILKLRQLILVYHLLSLYICDICLDKFELHELLTHHLIKRHARMLHHIVHETRTEWLGLRFIGYQFQFGYVTKETLIWYRLTR